MTTDKHRYPQEQKMPTTIEELWDTGWVAENEDEAQAQAERMFDLFHGRRVRVDRLQVIIDGDYDEILFQKPWPEVWVDSLDTNRGWDGDVLLPEWYVHAAKPRQWVKEHGKDGRRWRVGDLEAAMDWSLVTTAPGIGTAEGFGCKDRLIYPLAEAEDG